MRKINFAIVTIAFLALSAMPALTATTSTTPDVGDYFPPISGPTLDGGNYDLATQYNKGTYILIDFWASW